MVQSFEFVLEVLPVTVSSIPLIGNTIAKKFTIKQEIRRKTRIHLYIDLKYSGIPYSEKNEDTCICVWYWDYKAKPVKT